jgi:hypothetical protein
VETDALNSGRYSGAIVLADISGYTSFLDGVRVAHEADAFAGGRIPDAYALMSSLLDGIATSIDPPMTLVKFEGDAVFAVAPDGSAPRGRAMFDCVLGCYRDFGTRLTEAGLVWTCTCEACARKDMLDLKFVVHHGDYYVQAIGDRIEVLSPAVTVAHRLLKNTAAARIGSAAYSLFTEPAIDALALTLTNATAFSEPIEGSHPISVKAVPLH